jgi:hypothetical protein
MFQEKSLRLDTPKFFLQSPIFQSLDNSIIIGTSGLSDDYQKR